MIALPALTQADQNIEYEPLQFSSIGGGFPPGHTTLICRVFIINKD